MHRVRIESQFRPLNGGQFAPRVATLSTDHFSPIASHSRHLHRPVPAFRFTDG
jgi:hypothetical protein